MAVRARKTGIAAGLGAGKAVTPKAARARPSRRRPPSPPPDELPRSRSLAGGASGWGRTEARSRAGLAAAVRGRPCGRGAGRGGAPGLGGRLVGANGESRGQIKINPSAHVLAGPATVAPVSAP